MLTLLRNHSSFRSPVDMLRSGSEESSGVKLCTKRKTAVQARMAHRRALLRLLERGRKRQRRAGVARQVKFGANLGASRDVDSLRWYDYDVPEILDFFNHREDTYAFFTGLVELVQVYKKRVRITFLRSRHISSEAMIYLLGQIYILQEKYGKYALIGCYPKSRKIEHLLNESGFFALLGVKKRAVAGRKTGATRFLTFKSGNRLMSESIPKIRDELFGDDFQMPPSIKKDIFRALSEAMNNVGEHAYLNKQLKSTDLRGRWWMGASMSLKNNVFNLIFYDAGVGIPRTLPRKYNMEIIRRALSILPGFDLDDGSMIKAAVEIGRTRTLQDNRGKGLMDLHRLIDKSNAGRLRIISCKGWYEHEPSKNKCGSTIGLMEGTLISWQLPLDVAAVQINNSLQNEMELEDDKDISCT